MTNIINNTLNTLGLCYKAKKLIYGSKAIEAIRNNQAHLVIMVDDIAINTKTKFINKCEFYNVKLIRKFTTSQLSNAIGKNNIKAVVIIDSNFALKIKNNLGENYDK